MVKIKLTKGELKRQRDSLGQFRRYLPTLQLKKQQLQLEILQQTRVLNQKKEHEKVTFSEIKGWANLLADEGVDIQPFIVPGNIVTEAKNIAGVDIPVFSRAEFAPDDYDLFIMPHWVDHAVAALKNLASIRTEINVMEEGIRILRHELRITTQRVNLFEKVKIPEALEAIRRIKIYLGDQMANAVGRSKIAKRKIEAMLVGEAA